MNSVGGRERTSKVRRELNRSSCGVSPSSDCASEEEMIWRDWGARQRQMTIQT